jgi:hypothetical protein
MKQGIQLLSLVLIATVLFTQCKTAGAGAKVNMKKPESVALVFTQHLANLDVDAAKELGTEDTKKVLDFLSMAISMSGEEELKKMKEEAAANSKNLKKADCTVTGDEAKCKVCCDPEGKAMEDNEILLKKQDGKWLVHISKEDMMKGMDNGEINEEEPEED